MTDLYRVPAFCPICLRRAALRAYPAQVMAARGMEPETPLVSLQCTDRDCAAFFPVSAHDFARAVKERKAA